jgi:hypothetical protein
VKDVKYIQNFGQTTEEKIPLVSPRSRWENNLKWILIKLDSSVDWIHLERSCEDCNEPSQFIQGRVVWYFILRRFLSI